MGDVLLQRRKHSTNITKNIMNTTGLTITISADKTPKEAFDAITNVRGWWSEEVEGDARNVNDEFTYHYEDVHYCQIKLTEVIPSEKIVWLVKYNYFKFTKDKSEWTGTTISFDIFRNAKGTTIRFTHHGLVSAYECYDICSGAWSHYIEQSLVNLINTGSGAPNATGKPRTEKERELASGGR
jgi:hypothetical protein